MKIMIGKRSLQNLFIVVAVIFTSCTGGTIYHPVDVFLPEESKIDQIVDMDSMTSNHLYQDLILGSTISDTSFQNDFNNRLLHSAKFDIDPQGYVYIPQLFHTINVYNKEGQFLYNIGREGKGPGEYLRIFSFDFSEDYKKMFVLDAFEIEVYTQVGDKYEHERTFIHNLVSVKSICSLDGHLYISGFSPTDIGIKNENQSERIVSYPIHKFQKYPFKQVDSFGFEYQSYIDMPQFNRFMSGTELTCNSKSNTIIGQLDSFPYMFGYSPSGEVKWVTKFSNFLPTIYKEDARPSVIPDNKNPYHRVYPFREIHDEEFELLQIGYHQPFWFNYALSKGEDPEKPKINSPTYRSLKINSSTGEVHLVSSEKMIGAIRDNHALMIEVLDSIKYQHDVSLYTLQ